MDSIGELKNRSEHDAANDEANRNGASLLAKTPETNNGSAPTVIMLGGFGRSGSTLLERCLAQSEDFVGLGELVHLWERGLQNNELCGCGAAFMDCPFWQDIGRRAFDGWSHVDREETLSDRKTVVRNRYLPELILRKGFRSRRLPRKRFIAVLNRLYQAAYQSSGHRILVDSSKHPAYAYLLRAVRVDLRCVLVVRDPRGVAYSWSKIVARPETGSRGEDMPRYSITASIFNWTTYSIMFHALALLKVPVMTVHYEDFMTAPDVTLRQIHSFAGLGPDSKLPRFEGQQIVLNAHHTVAGNPMRFKVGEVKLKLDVAWRKKMARKDRQLAGLLSFPLRMMYKLGRR